ncbi:hypothetical protein Syn6312_0954 [Synechococcus sp. PCC 6312]|nr:hypothetical protein Syn6312_0954 [Synechococcus sp. PCC 6312]
MPQQGMKSKSLFESSYWSVLGFGYSQSKQSFYTDYEPTSLFNAYHESLKVPPLSELGCVPLHWFKVDQGLPESMPPHETLLLHPSCFQAPLPAW